MEVTVHHLDYVVIGLYFVGILFCGIWFGRNTKSTNDFFFGGQRFAWWLVAISCVATLVGSYSFLQYSESAFNNGISATMCYTNDWFIIPIFMLAWLPIIYFSKVTSIPEYFQRRFDEKTRMAVLFIILVYLIGYIGINLHTIGVAINGMLGINLYISVIVVAIVSAVYMHGGGQTSVIMTDLLQGFVLIAAGLLVLFFGLTELAGRDIAFWANLPQEHKLPFAKFNSNPKYNTVGLFWNDAITASIAFYCMNQGILMRFMSTRSVRDGKKAITVVVLLFMPIAAIAVCNAGWIGRVMVDTGILSANISAKHIFVKVSNMVCPPGVFGLVMAALVAALMSTIDTYITAVSAIVVNDIWRNKVKPGQEDKYYLGVARYVAIAATLLGICIVPFFNSFDSIFQAFSHFCALVVPPMVVVIVLAILWKRFTSAAAFWSLTLGFLINLVSLFVPKLVGLVAHGVSAAQNYSYMRAFFGTVVTLIIGVVVTFFTKPKEESEIPGLTLATIAEGQKLFKGGEPSTEGIGIKIPGKIEISDIEGISLSQEDMDAISAKPGDLLYLADNRWWLGGLYSVHVKADEPHNQKSVMRISQETMEQGNLSLERPVTIEKMM